MSAKKPPSLRKNFHEVVKFGDRRTDPFSWLRDDNWQDVLRDPLALSPEIRQHLEEETLFLEEQAEEFADLTAAISHELKKGLAPIDTAVPFLRGDYQYWYEYTDNGDYPVYMRKNIHTGTKQVLLDTEKEAYGSDYFDVRTLIHSPDHKTIAYAVDLEGAGSFSIRFRDVATGLELDDILTGAQGEIVWPPGDPSRIYYTACDERHIAKAVKMHVLGTPQKEDTVVYEERAADLSLSIRESSSEKFIFIESMESAEQCVETRYVDAYSSFAADPVLISAREKGHEYSVDHGGGYFYIRTNANGAANGKIMRAPIDAPERENWADFVPHDPGTLIKDIYLLRHFMVRLETCGTFERIVITDTDGNETVAPFPAMPGKIFIHPPPAFNVKNITVEIQTLANPGEFYNLDLRTGKKSLLEKTPLPEGRRPEDYIVERKFITSRDGATEIPVTILRHASVKADGAVPLYLSSYGAYGSDPETDFSAKAIALANRGVVFAFAHVRGGNEKGTDWHAQGQERHKWNTFHDFIDAAEGLCAIGYGEKGKIVIEGRSAGGLLMGVVLNEKPELFAGAIVGEAFLDVLNTMSDPGLPWVREEKAEWGDPEDEDMYFILRSYSPYDNIRKDKTYPAILATTGLLDSCVLYWEPAKWIARLRDEAQGGPFYLKTNTGSGHDGASARLEKTDEMALEIGFALHRFRECGYDIAPLATPGIKQPQKPRPPKIN